MGRTSTRKGAVVGGSKWPKEQQLKEAYEQLRQRKKALALNPDAAAKQPGAGATAPAPARPSDAAKAGRVSSASLVAPPLAGETKDTGFKRPAKLQRKLDEIKENPSAAEEKPAKKRRTSADEAKPSEREETPPYYTPYGGYFRGHLEEPVDGEYYPTTIFVGGLADSVEERDLERAFSRFGPIDAIRLIHNKNFGFIKFRSPDACQASILGMNGEILNGSRVRVDRAKVPSAKPAPWPRRAWGDRRPYPPRDDGGPYGGGGEDYYSRGGGGGGEGSYDSYGGGGYMPRERDAPYGLASLRGESTPLPFPATPQPYSSNPSSSSSSSSGGSPAMATASPSSAASSPSTPPHDRETEGSPALDAEGDASGEGAGRRAVQYDDL